MKDNNNCPNCGMELKRVPQRMMNNREYQYVICPSNACGYWGCYRLEFSSSEKIYWDDCIWCPKINGYALASRCEVCPNGKIGSYADKWTLCSYDGSTSTIPKEEK